MAELMPWLEPLYRRFAAAMAAEDVHPRRCARRAARRGQRGARPSARRPLVVRASARGG